MSTQCSYTALAILLEPLVPASGAVGVAMLVATATSIELGMTCGSSYMDLSEGASSEGTPELNGGGAAVDRATATDGNSPSLVGAALVVGATDEGSSVAVHEALTTSTRSGESALDSWASHKEPINTAKTTLSPTKTAVALPFLLLVKATIACSLPQSPSPNALSNPPTIVPPSASTLGSSDTSPANSNGPLANSNTFSAAVDTFPKPLEPSSTVPDPIAILGSLLWFTQPNPEHHNKPGAACQSHQNIAMAHLLIATDTCQLCMASSSPATTPAVP
ncbi:hypothetical protein E4T56_gene7040 [Termitomyces sp. T112]|nr:hypothetical protein E4T56_gene7040 [Termitomyces sp. T112]